MAFMIDPSAEDNNNGGGSSNRRPDVRAGNKTVALCGLTYGESRSGNVKIDTCWMVVDDPDGGTDYRALVFDTFTLTARAAWKLQQVAAAVGQTASWDAEDEEATWKVLSQQPISAEIAMEPKYNGDGERAAVQRYSRTAFKYTDEIEDELATAEQWYVEWRKKKAGGASTGGASVASDDIPF